MGHVQSYHPVLENKSKLPRPSDLVTKKELEALGMTCAEDGRVQLPLGWNVEETYTDGRALTIAKVFDAKKIHVATLRSTQSQYCISPTHKTHSE